jgi:hypothetical protein
VPSGRQYPLNDLKYRNDHLRNKFLYSGFRGRSSNLGKNKPGKPQDLNYDKGNWKDGKLLNLNVLYRALMIGLLQTAMNHDCTSACRSMSDFHRNDYEELHYGQR